jgi:hypothetical protein
MLPGNLISRINESGKNLLGAAKMRSCKREIAALMAFSLAALATAGSARADDLPVKAKVKPVADVPLFFVIDDRVSYSWMPKGTDPGMFSVRPNGSIDGSTSKSVYSFTHFDAWAYGTNFFSISLYKSDQNDPASPCVAPGVNVFGGASSCAGASDVFGLVRSTFGFNEIFDTKAFSIGPLHNLSLEVGVQAETENTFLAPAHRAAVAGLEFAFDLPYKGYFNVAPLVYDEFSHHNAFIQCGLFAFTPGADCTTDGNRSYKVTWAVETNYYMDLGFLPQTMQFFSISGRLAWYGPKGDENAPLTGTGVGRFSTATKTEFNSEPIRLTFDASKAFAGPKSSHLVDVWVAYRYWQNKFGLDHDAAPGICTIAATGQSTNSCTESSVYTGVTLKF